MNERIKEMWKQAEDFAKQDWARRMSEAHPLYRPGEYDDMIQKKFAELIVKECIEQIVTGPNGPAHYAMEAALRVKKHFGVE